MTGYPSAATPHDIARFGHIAALLRAEMTKRDWRVADLAAAMGLERTATSPYPWLRGVAAPGTKMRPKLAKALKVSEDALMPREIDGVPPTALMVRPPAGAVRVRSGGDALVFRITETGEAQIKLDLTLPLETAKPLLRMLLDAGLVFGGEGGGP